MTWDIGFEKWLAQEKKKKARAKTFDKESARQTSATIAVLRNTYPHLLPKETYAVARKGYGPDSPVVKELAKRRARKNPRAVADQQRRKLAARKKAARERKKQQGGWLDDLIRNPAAELASSWKEGVGDALGLGNRAARGMGAGISDAFATETEALGTLRDTVGTAAGEAVGAVAPHIAENAMQTIEPVARSVAPIAGAVAQGAAHAAQRTAGQVSAIGDVAGQLAEPTGQLLSQTGRGIANAPLTPPIDGDDALTLGEVAVGSAAAGGAAAGEAGEKIGGVAGAIGELPTPSMFRNLGAPDTVGASVGGAWDTAGEGIKDTLRTGFLTADAPLGLVKAGLRATSVVMYRRKPGEGFNPIPEIYEELKRSGGVAAIEALADRSIGEKVEIGEGFFPGAAVDPTTGEEYGAWYDAEQASESAKIRGLSISPGRTVSHLFFDPDSQAFDVASGLLDLTFTVTGDPIAGAGAGVARANRARRFVSVPERLRGYTPTFDRLAEKAVERGARRLGVDDAEKFRRRVLLHGNWRDAVDVDAADEWLRNSKHGQNVVTYITEANAPDVARVLGGRADPDFVMALAANRDRDTTLEILKDAVNGNFRYKIKAPEDERRLIRPSQWMQAEPYRNARAFRDVPAEKLEWNHAGRRFNFRTAENYLINAGITDQSIIDRNVQNILAASTSDATPEMQYEATKLLMDDVLAQVMRKLDVQPEVELPRLTPEVQAARAKGEWIASAPATIKGREGEIGEIAAIADGKATVRFGDDATEVDVKDLIPATGVRRSPKEQKRLALARRLTTIWRDDAMTNRAYNITALGENAWFPGVKIRGENIALPTPHLLVEGLNSTVPLPDFRAIRRVTASKTFRWMIMNEDTSDLRLPLRAVERLSNEIWKPMQLLRIAWPMRVLGEQQFRLAAAGYDSPMQHPISYLAAVVSEGPDGWFHKVVGETTGPMDEARNFARWGRANVHKGTAKAVNAVSKATRGLTPTAGYRHTDVFGEMFVNRDKFQPYADEFARVGSSVEAILDRARRVKNKGKDVVESGHPMFYQGWAEELVTVHVDPLAARVAAGGLFKGDVIGGPMVTPRARLYATDEVVDQYYDAAGVQRRGQFSERDLEQALDARGLPADIQWQKVRMRVEDLPNRFDATDVTRLEDFTPQERYGLEELIEAYRRGDEIAPPVHIPGDQWPLNGNHRLWAAKRAGVEELDVFVPATPGSATALPEVDVDRQSMDAIKEWFFHSPERDRIMKMQSLSDVRRNGDIIRREDSDLFIDSIAARIREKTGDHPDIMEAVRTGKLGNESMFLRNGQISPRFVKKLRDEYGSNVLDDFVRRNLGDEWHGEKAHVRGPVYTSPEEISRYDKAVRAMFTSLMGVPDQKLFRQPMFRQVYWRRAEEMAGRLTKEAQQQLQQAAVKAGLTKEEMRRLGVATSRSNGKMELEELSARAKADALDTVQDLLYDLHRRGQVADAARLIVPFGEAWKEVLTTWAKLAAENPNVPRRLQQVVDSGRRSEFIYKHEITGKEMLNVPMTGALSKALTGIPFGFDMELQGMNIAASLIPGVGPALQIPMSLVVDHLPGEDFIRSVLFPFGVPDVNGWEDIVTTMLPAYGRKVSGAMSDESMMEDFASSIVHVGEYLMSSGRYDTSNVDHLKKWEADTTLKARMFTLLRAGLQMVLPAAPNPKWSVETNEHLRTVASLRKELREMEDQYGYHEAPRKFLAKYGDDVFLLLEGANIGSSPATVAAAEFAEANPKFREKWRTVYGYFVPDYEEGDPRAEFDPDFFGRQKREGEVRPHAVKPGARERFGSKLAESQARQAQAEWNYLQTQALKASGGKKVSAANQKVLNRAKARLHELYPAWDDTFTIGATGVRIRDLKAAAHDPLAKKLPVARTMRDYFQVRDALIEAQGKGKDALTTSGPWKGALAQLNEYGNALAQYDRNFARVWEQVLSRELGLEDE